MRLLLAEDERELSNALVTVLKRNNYTVDAVYDGEEATDYLETGVYDAVILDIMMPKKDGISVLKDLRAAGNRVPVMMLTAKAEIDDRVLGLDTGADDYLAKPFAMKELLARIRALCRRQTEIQDNRLVFSNMTLDRSSYELASQNGSLRLANKEFQMMELLMANPSQVISVGQFMDKIWGFDSEAEMNVVWVYVSYLRKRLTAVGAKAQIKAHRNQGYSLEETK